MLDRLSHRCYRLLDRLWSEIAHDQNLGLCTDTLPRACRVILAVRPWKYGDADTRFCDFERTCHMLSLRIGSVCRAIDLPHGVRYRRRENLLKRLGIRRLHIGEYNGIKICDDARHITCDTDLNCARSRKIFCQMKRGCYLEQNRSIKRLKEIILRNE